MVVCEVWVLMVMVLWVVNGNFNVKLEICKKVLDVIKELNYCLNVVVWGLVFKKIIMVGVVILDVINDYFFKLVFGIDDIVFMYKYNMILINLDVDDYKVL